MSLLQINAMLMGNQYRYPANALYTKEQVDTLILTNSYIPIANSSELVNLVQSASQTMGKGTPWQGNYTTGLDKKYIVVTNFTIASNITNTLDNFAGIFDGNELKLTYNYGNLFGTPDASAKYYNLNVYGNITSNGYLGGIWYTFSAYAENCTFTGSILNSQGSLARLGGLAVTTSSSTILKNCSTNVNITSTINDSNGGLGGLVALGNGGTFENCHSSGIYNGFSNTGGLIGSISSGDLILNNCSSDAVITGTINTGGLIGFFNRNTNSFSTIGINEFTGSVDGESNLGGIIGGFEGISANDINVSKLHSTGNITGSGNYIGGLFGMSFLSTKEINISDSYCSGDVQGNDYVGGIVGSSNSLKFTTCSYTGNITGRNYSGGIVGKATNIFLEDCESTGIINSLNNGGGGLIGYVLNTLHLSNCSSSMVLNGVNKTGGLIGYANTTEFITTGINKFTGNINVNGSGGAIGGVIGSFRNNMTSNCVISKLQSTGNVIGNLIRVGGLIGQVYNNTSLDLTITNSFATGNVQGDNMIGGLIGICYETVIVKNCYSTGAVSGNSDSGGLIGNDNNNAVTVINSYWDTETSGQATSDGGTGKTTVEMQQGSIPDTNIYVDWDSLIWGSGSTSEYPILKTVTASNKYLATEIVNDELVDQYGNINIPIVSGLVTDGTAILDLAGFGTTYDKSYYIGNSEGKDENWDYPFIYFDTNNPTHWKIEELNYRMIEEQYIAGDGNLKKLYAKLLYSGGTLQGLDSLYLYNNAVVDETAILSVIGILDDYYSEKYMSNFATSVDGWIGSKMNLSYNQSISSVDECLKISANSEDNQHYFIKQFDESFAPFSGNLVRVTFDYYIPSTNDTIKAIGIPRQFVTGSFNIVYSETDVWTNTETIFNFRYLALFQYYLMYSGIEENLSISFMGNNDDVYLKNFRIEKFYHNYYIGEES